MRYSVKGNIIGTIVGGIIESRHDTGVVIPFQPVRPAKTVDDFWNGPS